ncbi:unnamed protein product [Penicillium pancosmium]
MECGRLCAEAAQTPLSHLYRLWILVLMRKRSLLAPTVIMKLSTWALYFTTLGPATAWQLKAGSQTWTGSTAQGCRTVFIPRGPQISWRGSRGANTVQFFNVQGSCSRVYRTVMGVGDINASNNIYGFVVKA